MATEVVVVPMGGHTKTVVVRPSEDMLEGCCY